MRGVRRFFLFLDLRRPFCADGEEEEADEADADAGSGSEAVSNNMRTPSMASLSKNDSNTASRATGVGNAVLMTERVDGTGDDA